MLHLLSFIRPKVAAHNTRAANLRRPVLFVRDKSRQLKSDVHHVTKLDQLASICSRAFRDSRMLQSFHPCSLQCVVSTFLDIRVIFYCTMSKALILSIFVLCFLAFGSSTHVKFMNCGKSSSDPLYSIETMLSLLKLMLTFFLSAVFLKFLRIF